MKKWIPIAILCCLAACSVTPTTSPEAESEILPQENFANVSSQQSVIDEEVLYLLMTAELAGQRNQYFLAMDAYLQAAKRVDDPRIAERAVKIGLFLKDEKRTKEALDVWLAKDDKNLGARKFAVLLAIKSADAKSATDNLEALLTDDPAGFESSLLDMLKLLEKEGRTQFTYDVLEAIHQRYPNQVEVLFVQAILASIMPDKDLAQQKIDAVLKLQPDWNKALVLQAQIAGRNGDLPKTRVFLEKALKQSPDDIQIRKMLLEVLTNMGAYDDAIHLCMTVLEEKPEDAESIFALALIYIQQNQFDKAENYLDKLLNNPDWSSQANFYLGKLEMERHRSDKALARFDKVVAGNYAFDAELASISILLNQKRMDEVEVRIKHMELKYPEHKIRTLMLKAEYLNQATRYLEAFEVLTSALNEMPDNRDILYARALIAERVNRLDVLESDLKKILQKNPDDVSALNAYGYTLTDKTDRYDEAEKYLDKALQLQPEEAVIIDSYGWLQFKRGNPQKALEYLRKAYAKSPENEIAAHVAEVLWVLGNHKEAKDFFDLAFKKSPNDEYLLEFKRKFLSAEQK